MRNQSRQRSAIESPAISGVAEPLLLDMIAMPFPGGYAGY